MMQLQQHKENMKIMKLFEHHNIGISNYINKSVGRMVGDKNKSLGVNLTYDNTFQHAYMPLDGIYKLSVYEKAIKQEKIK